MSEQATPGDVGDRLGVVFEKHVEALAARQTRIEAERDVLVRLFRIMHSNGVISVEYGSIGAMGSIGVPFWDESLSYDEDVVLRRILDANQ